LFLLSSVPVEPRDISHALLEAEFDQQRRLLPTLEDDQQQADEGNRF
jgi:hypothetical protein